MGDGRSDYWGAQTYRADAAGKPPAFPRYEYPPDLDSKGQVKRRPAPERIEQLRSRIPALPPVKQKLLAEYVKVRCPEAISTDAGASSAINPHSLDDSSVDAILEHLVLLEEDPQPYAYPAADPGPRDERAWRTGYVGDMPPRSRGPRPNGTFTTGSGMPGSRSAVAWEEFMSSGNPPAADQPHWMYGPTGPPPMAPPPPGPLIDPMGMKSLPRVAAPPEPFVGSVVQSINKHAFSEEEVRDRTALAKRIQTLSEAHQQTVSQEVRQLCPRAIYQPAPGYATINTSELDRATFGRVHQLVDELQELGQEDADREQDRLLRRQLERQNYIARERARERERAMDLEREKRAREDQIKDDLERDLALVRDEVEQERRARWIVEGERKDQDMLEKFNVATRELYQPPRQALPPPTGAYETDDTAELRLHLRDTLRKLDDTSLLDFSDYLVSLEPGAISDNYIRPSNISKAMLPLALNYAAQLKAKQNAVFNADGDYPTKTEPPLPPPPEEPPLTREAPTESVPPPPEPPTNDRAAAPSPPQPAEQQPATGEVARLPEHELKEREQVSKQIFSLERQQQKQVCNWLRQNIPSAIVAEGGSTSIETGYMSGREFERLKSFLADL